MNRILILALFSVFAFGLSAQSYTSTEENDPEATTILDAVREKYESYSSMEVTFTMDMEIPQQDKISEQILMQRSGAKYKVNFGAQEIFSDGVALYMVLHQNKSVQINDLPDESEGINFLTPAALFSFYKSGEFIYTLMDTHAENGVVCHYIEFKPTDTYSEYSKLRMVINRNTNELVRIKVFAKDGSRYTLSLTEFVANKDFSSDYFLYNSSKYTDYYTEDLRE